MSRRLRVRLLHGIEAFEFDARISSTELPVRGADSLIAMILPALDLLTQFFHGGNVVRQALPRQDTQFNLGNIQPTCMLGSVMNLQTIGQGFGLLRRKNLVERSWGMRI